MRSQFFRHMRRLQKDLCLEGYYYAKTKLTGDSICSASVSRTAASVHSMMMIKSLFGKLVPYHFISHDWGLVSLVRNPSISGKAWLSKLYFFHN